MSYPERLRPGVTRETVTERAAAMFAELAQELRDRGGERRQHRFVIAATKTPSRKHTT